MASRSQEPTDGASCCESALGTILRQRNRAHLRRFWFARHVADASRIARLVSRGTDGQWLVAQEAGQDDCDVGHVPTVVTDHAGKAPERSGEPVVLARP